MKLHDSFSEWCKENGILHPKLKFPIFTDFNQIGIGCKSNIQNREAFLAVPYKCLFSVDKVLNHPVLGPIIEEN